MTREEICKKYNVSEDLLDDFSKRGLCGSMKDVFDAWQYNDTDIERLGKIVTLYQIGFKPDEIEHYIKLMIQGKSTEKERLEILNKKRNDSLDEIHLKEKHLASLDYIRHKLQKDYNNGNE